MLLEEGIEGGDGREFRERASTPSVILAAFHVNLHYLGAVQRCKILAAALSLVRNLLH